MLDSILDGLSDRTGPTDLCAELAAPFAARMVFDVVGVREEDRPLCLHRSHLLRVSEGPPPVLDPARIRVMADTGQDEATLAFFDVTEHETLAARIAYGLLFLLAYPDQLCRLQRTPALISSAVEEILRLAVPGGSWIPRYAREDIEFGPILIERGDLVVFSLQSANRDEGVFPDANRFLIDRSPNQHIGFGYGKYHCLAAHLSRLLLRTAISTVFSRMPGLRLAVPLDRIEVDRTQVTGGLNALPVVW
ncbi:cytochrome P450 [Nonomuraea bangladeshensis]|uniref:Cytochrome P450 n=1 Tax=Nonomuraea bangladeshensis TaxID=404385 RepID=A0ABV3HFE2_9ACTN